MPREGPGRNVVEQSLGRADIRNVYRVGSRYATPVATVHVLRTPHRALRVAVPVGKRIGSSVVRNRVRRRLREAFRVVEKELGLEGDIVIVARSAARTAPFGTLVAELRHALTDAWPHIA